MGEGLIEYTETWFEFLEQCNSTVHTYNQDVAEEIMDHLPVFQKALSSLITTIRKL